jgi:predicted RNA-binding Zn-ribbon protein involved in translation (DUF1610 family)
MSIVEMRCPRCGAFCNLQQGKTDEYICSHCGTTFRFVDSSHTSLTTDFKTHICPYCGRHVESGKGFRCAHCGKDFICQSCVNLVQGKYVCVDCTEHMALNCQACRKFATYGCLSCGRRACKEHAMHVGFIDRYNVGDRELKQQIERVLYCPRCASFVCKSCVRKGFLSDTEKCPKCRSNLVQYSPYT